MLLRVLGKESKMVIKSGTKGQIKKLKSPRKTEFKKPVKNRKQWKIYTTNFAANMPNTPLPGYKP